MRQTNLDSLLSGSPEANDYFSRLPHSLQMQIRHEAPGTQSLSQLRQTADELYWGYEV